MNEPGNGIGPKGAAALVPALQQLTGLKKLKLSSKCVIGGWTGVTVCDDPHAQYPATRSLVIGGVDMYTSEWIFHSI